jgi:hypothetical protein
MLRTDRFNRRTDPHAIAATFGIAATPAIHSSWLAHPNRRTSGADVRLCGYTATVVQTSLDAESSLLEWESALRRFAASAGQTSRSWLSRKSRCGVARVIEGWDLQRLQGPLVTCNECFLLRTCPPLQLPLPFQAVCSACVFLCIDHPHRAMPCRVPCGRSKVVPH